MSVCLVEDDPSIALVVTTILKREGWIVWHVSSAEAARAGFAERAAEGEVVSLMITDRNLDGEETGEDLARTLRVAYPSLAVVVISGDYDVSAVLSDGVVQLPKPFRKAALLEAVTSAQAAIS
ncbi:response regulator [Neokomagataea sp. TBRC 2177]|uniref:Response regulator n=1 Tax=Neokomagataea anthophila TaxID=2826925 RepID=A0ABS5E9P4_9PROT|nr:response regulator [Neokomagataea anthophila]MBR0560630.1 response regulator [Neokomagataea anthophila]